MIIKDYFLKNKLFSIIFVVIFVIIFIFYSFNNNDYFILSENDKPFFTIPENKEGITINVRYKNENGTTNMYYDSLESNTSDKKVPFNTFDTTVPIAVLTQTSNNTLSIYCKCFSVSCDLAVDYVILGKKNLEGKFVKQ